MCYIDLRLVHSALHNSYKSFVFPKLSIFTRLSLSRPFGVLFFLMYNLPVCIQVWLSKLLKWAETCLQYKNNLLSDGEYPTSKPNRVNCRAEISTDQDGIGLDQDWGQLWPDRTGSDCIFIQNWRIRTGSHWQNFCYFIVIILKTSKIAVMIRFHWFAKW